MPVLKKTEELKEWTIMFYFASDNPLASGIVSQLKAIKDARFHQQANVIAYFDPQTKNTPSHVFDVNLVDKLIHSRNRRSTFPANDPFVRNLVLDKLWSEKDEATRTRIKNYLESKYNVKKYDPPRPPNELGDEQYPRQSLKSFLDFCAVNYKARHYMLLILGHGVVVGNDIFLLDENIPDDDDDDDAPPTDNNPTPNTGNNDQGDPNADSIIRRTLRHSLTLRAMGEELLLFKEKISEHGGQFEAIGLHSCSMSGLEVAYELSGTANYLLASQGPAYVGSWPYKQILTRIFNDLEKRVRPSVKKMLTKIFAFCINNSFDFQLAGYSFDMSMCDLKKLKDEQQGMTAPLKKLVKALRDGLKGENVKGSPERNGIVKEMILLAHWDAQSFWQEQYIDLFDFCFSLYSRCKPHLKKSPALRKISAECKNIIKVLKRGYDGLIVRSEFVGPAYQYSHGLSVFFPWSEPVDRAFKRRYRNYKFITDFIAEGKKGADPFSTTWLGFLETYFNETRRGIRREDEATIAKIEGRSEGTPERVSLEDELLAVLESISSSVFSSGGPLSLAKGGSRDPAGDDDCNCPSIKNYPFFTRRIGKDGKIIEGEGLLNWSLPLQIKEE